MKIALYSDLHLDLATWEPPEINVDVIILAGDIHMLAVGISWAAKTFPDTPVIYVPGNHEFYRGNLRMLDTMRKTAEQFGVYFLSNDSVKIQGVRFLGTTLWSDFALYGDPEAAMIAAHERINDYWKIKHVHNGELITPADTLRFHQEAVAWLDAELSKPHDGKTIVVTHFPPHPDCVDNEYKGSELTPYFTSDLRDLMAKHKIDLWAYGHDHGSDDFNDAYSGTRVTSNQRGYKTEFGRSRFDPKLVIDLDNNVCREIPRMSITRYNGDFISQVNALAKVTPREETGYIHLDDLPAWFAKEFEQWLHGQTCPGDINNPDEMMAFPLDFERWRKNILRKAGWVKGDRKC